MSSIKLAYKFFKTWFLPQHSDEDVHPLPSVAFSANPALAPSETAPAKSTHFVEPESFDRTEEENPAAPDEHSFYASYAIPPVPAAMQPTPLPDPPPATPAPEHVKQEPKDTPPNSDPADFSHLVKAPAGADFRQSRRRMEGADPAAFE